MCIPPQAIQLFRGVAWVLLFTGLSLAVNAGPAQAAWTMANDAELQVDLLEGFFLPLQFDPLQPVARQNDKRLTAELSSRLEKRQQNHRVQFRLRAVSRTHEMRTDLDSQEITPGFDLRYMIGAGWRTEIRLENQFRRRDDRSFATSRRVRVRMGRRLSPLFGVRAEGRVTRTDFNRSNGSDNVAYRAESRGEWFVSGNRDRRVRLTFRYDRTNANADRSSFTQQRAFLKFPWKFDGPMFGLPGRYAIEPEFIYGRIEFQGRDRVQVNERRSTTRQTAKLQLARKFDKEREIYLVAETSRRKSSITRFNADTQRLSFGAELSF